MPFENYFSVSPTQPPMEVTNPFSQSDATPRADAPVSLVALKRRRSTNTFHKIQRARLRSFLCRLDVCWTLLFLVFLVCVAVTTTAITQTHISKALLERLHDTHDMHVYTLQKSLDLTTLRVFNMVVDLVTLHPQQPFVFGSQDTLSTLCSVLAQFDQSLYLRALTLNSLELKEAMACIHGDVSMPSPYQLYGWITKNSVIPGVYLINNSTNHFDQPLQAVYGGWDTSAYNQSGSFSADFQDSAVFHEVNAYYNGTLQYIDYRKMWPHSFLLPHIIPILVPVGFLFKGLNLPANTNVTDYVGVRFNGAAVLDPAITALSPNITAAIFINASLTDDDPLIMSNNWGQQSVNDTVILATDRYNAVKYLTSSNVSDPLMRAALKHVNLKALQQEGHNETVDFQYRGAPATVTAATLTTSRGLVLPMVFASANADIATPYRRIMDICNGATAVAVVCFTALLGVLLHRYLHQPLQRMTDRMAEDARTGRYEPVREPALQLFRLSETHALLQAHRDTVQQLREIQRFIPRDVRLQMARGVRSTTSAATAGGADAAADEHVAAAAAAARGALVRQVSTLVQVLVRPCVCGAGAAVGGAAAALVAPQQQPPPGTRHRLAAVVEQAARAAELVNSGPFPTPAALGGFVAALQELCEEHGGTLHRLAPDGCALHFGRAVRARVACGGAAADAAALEVCAAQDARAAMRFAFALLRWVDRCGVAGMPDVRVLVDSSPFVCGRHRPRGSEQTLSVALGRDVKRVLGTVPASIGVRVAMTEETAVLVRAGNVVGGPAGGVRQIPVDAFRVGRAVLDGDVVILFEALPGAAADDDAWRTYFHTCCTAFSALVRGQYAAALGVFKQVADIADLEPGLMPSSMRREAAASRAVSGAVSVQVQRLMRECVNRVARGDTRPLCRTLIDRLGIDAVLAAVTPAGVPPEAIVGRNSGQSRRGAGLSSLAAAASTSVALDALGPKSAERFVVELRDSSTTVRTVLGSPLDWLVDNNGLRWTIAKEKLNYTVKGMWAARFPCLGSAGTVANVNFVAFRDVARPVANAIRNAPLGPMSDALRSATPVFVITPQLNASLQKLYAKQFQVRHPNLLVPLGYSTSWEGGVVMIWEHNAGGTLRELRTRYYRIKLVTAARFLYGIISAVAYLHSEDLVHGALSLDNIFVGADGVCRLRGHLVDQEKVLLKLVLLRVCYVSPAMATGKPPTQACDMFCYGLLCIELLSGAKAWRWAPVPEDQPQPSDDELAALMAAAEQPFFDAVAAGRIVANIEALDAVVPVNESESRFINVVRACLQSDPALRPLSGAVAVGIEEVLALGADSESFPT